MFAFNKLTGFTASLADLKNWSGDIGSDITFFFSTGTAYCTGRGEIIEPLPQLPKSDADALRIHIFKPSEGLSTKLVFQTLNIKTMCSQTDPLKLLHLFKQLGPLNAAVEGGLTNDLELPAFECSPKLGQLKKEIIEMTSSERVMMSGSGTSMYALSDSKVNSLPTEKIDAFKSKHKDLKYFECTCISKENTVTSWYDL